MKKTLTAVAVFALSASLAFAGPGEWKGGHRGHGKAGFSQKMAEKLNLTDAQKQQIKDIEKNFREQNKAFFESARTLHQQFRAARQANDQATLDSLKPQMEAQRAQMKQLRDAQFAQIRNVLTAEQRAQLDAWKAQREARRGQKP